MKYPTLQAVHDAQDANDTHLLHVWHTELPAPRGEHQREVMQAIRTAAIALGLIDTEDYHEQHSLFEIGGEG